MMLSKRRITPSLQRGKDIYSLPALTKQTSDTFRVIRAVCIILMITVHIWLGSTRIIAADHGPVWNIFFSIIIDYLGRAAVPALSLISGILFVYTFRRKGSALSVIPDKFMTLIAPMALWSLPVLLLILTKYHLSGVDNVILPTDALGWINQVLSITEAPANFPLHFLRDIFLCYVYGAIIILVMKRSTMAALTMLIVVAVLEAHPDYGLLLRPQILFFFGAGLLLAIFGHANWTPGWWLIFILLTADLLLQFNILTSVPDFIAIQQELIHRIAVSFLAWRVCRHLTEHHARMARAVILLDKDIFVIFCSHMVTIMVVGGLALAFSWNEAQPYYPALFIAQIVLCVVVGIALSRLLKPFPVLRGKGKWPARRAGEKEIYSA